MRSRPPEIFACTSSDHWDLEDFIAPDVEKM